MSSFPCCCGPVVNNDLSVDLSQQHTIVHLERRYKKYKNTKISLWFAFLGPGKIRRRRTIDQFLPFPVSCEKITEGTSADASNRLQESRPGEKRNRLVSMAF